MRAGTPGNSRTVTQLEVDHWWQSLAPAERRSLRRPRERRSLQVIGRFVESGPAEASDDTTDFYEYLVNHELTLDDGRTFHICSAHPEARAVLASGLVPSTFRCPRGAAACPMQALLSESPSCDVRLAVATVPR